VKRDEVEARNSLDNMVYNVEKMLKDNGDKVSGSDKTDVESALSQAKTTLQGSSSAADLNSAREKLTAASHKLAEAMYKANASGSSAPSDGGAAAGGTTEEKKEEGVIDAEYVDVADKK
jgi:molecular chaperone DnaK